MGENDIVTGRKGIIQYLRPIINLSQDPETAWNKIKRWKKRYGMDKLIYHLPSGECMMSKSEFLRWIKMSDIIAQSIKEKALNKEVKGK